MKFTPVKTAVIGAGMISDTYLSNMKTFSILDLVGVSDLVGSKSAAQAEKYGIRQMTNEEILNDPSIELVVNLTYASAHYDVNKTILNAGKNCYCEKMMATTVPQARELLELSRAKKLYFSVAPDTFLGASMQTNRYFIDLGIIGEPVMGVIRLARNYQLIKSDEDDAKRLYSVVRPGGGIPYDMGGYYLHTLFNIFGPVARASGFSFTHDKVRPYLNPRHSKFDEPFVMETENTITGALEFRCGFHATMAITSECNGGDANSFEIFGTQGSLSLGDPNNFNGKVFYKKNGAEKTEFPLTHPFGDRPSHRGLGVAEMAWSMRLGRKQRLLPEMGFHALEVVRGILDSGNDGTVKTFDTVFDRPAPLPPIRLGGATDERALYM